jgi:CheY-like chemotaxis protein
VIASSSPLEALDIYRSNKDQISLVILDLIMPQMGGRECLTKMIGMNPDVSAIIASGYNFESDDRENLLEIARGFVRKPYRTDELLLQIRRILDN